MHHRLRLPLLAFSAAWMVARLASAAEPVVTILADFEDESVAANIGEVRDVLAADCSAQLASIPARGRKSLALEIGATLPNASVACDLRFRVATRFVQADRVAAFCWIKEGQATLTFHIRDAADQLFETQPQTVRDPNRWTRVAADLALDQLKPLRRNRPLKWPIQVAGYRVATSRLGRQTVYLDDLSVEHAVDRTQAVLGEFVFDEPTRIYRPGTSVGVGVVLENRSRSRPVRVSVELDWTRPDASVLMTQRESVNLPASGVDYRSAQKLDFSQHIDQPGLYRLVARVRGVGWPAPHVVESTIAVTPSNRDLPRGRSNFFAVRTNLLREPVADQLLEIALARDLGVHLLAVETPWRRIEPKPDQFDFRALDRVVDEVVGKNMALMVVLSEPPAWLSEPAALPGRRDLLLEELARRYRAKLPLVQLTRETLGTTPVADQADALHQLQQRLATVHPGIRVVSAPLPLAPRDAAKLPAAALVETPFDWCFQTEGSSLDALDALADAAKRNGLAWQRSHGWLHVAEPRLGPGPFRDAEDLLHQYVHAATSGVSTLTWFDLRDDNNDPQELDTLRGLVRRDFSPRTRLLGYATAVGMLTGVRYAGPVVGAPDGFDSAVFVGSERQVAVLLPKPNRIRPAIFTPIQGVPGKFRVLDFERREQPLATALGRAVATTRAEPLFVTLELTSAQPEPQVAIARPWLNIPARAFCREDAALEITLEPPLPLRNSYLQVVLPANSPLESSVSATALKGEPGQTLRQEVRLTPKPSAVFERTEIAVRVSLEGDQVDVRVEVMPLGRIVPLAGGVPITDDVYRIAMLAAPPDADTRTRCRLHAAHAPDALHLAVLVEDHQPVAFQALPGDATQGDELRLGIALENADRHAEVRISSGTDQPELQPVGGTGPLQLEGWTCKVSAPTKERLRTYALWIPISSLGVRRLSPSTHVLLAARYLDDNGSGQRISLAWGVGLDDSRSSEGFRWLTLSADQRAGRANTEP